MLIKQKSDGKLTYSIGQVAKHTDLPQSVLRYWETVFTILNPVKSAGGSRQYSDDDVAIILSIKELLYDNGFTIKGANLQLDKDFNPKEESTLRGPDRTLSVDNNAGLIKQLKELIKLLED